MNSNLANRTQTTARGGNGWRHRRHTCRLLLELVKGVCSPLLLQHIGLCLPISPPPLAAVPSARIASSLARMERPPAPVSPRDHELSIAQDENLPQPGGSGAARGRARRRQPCPASNRVQAPLRAFSAYPDSACGEAAERSAWGRAPTVRGTDTPLSQSPASTRRAERGSSSILRNCVQVGGSLPVDGARPDRAASK
jgi:hypothetical protein